MGILSSSQSLTRYMVKGEPKIDESAIQMIQSALIKFAIPTIDGESEQIRMGFVPFEEPYDPDFNKHDFIYGSEIVFSFRIDRKKIQASVLKEQVSFAIRRRLEDTGREFLSKTEKKEIKENIVFDLIRKTPFAPSIVDVHWNYEKGIITVFATSKTVLETFESFFLKAFGQLIIRLFPYTIAMKNDISLEGVGFKSSLDIAVAYHRYAPIGSEFLAWLWYATENDEDTINTVAAMGEHHTILFAWNSITTVNKDEDGKVKAKISIRGADAGYKEAAMSLINGGRITEMNFDMTVGGNQFSFTINAETFMFKGLKVPASQTEKTEDGVAGEVLEKLHLDGIVFEIMDKFLLHFMGLKESGFWETKMASDIRSWLEDSCHE